LAPEWKKAAGELAGKVNLAAVDATVHSGLAQRYGVQGYPTIKVFGAGDKKEKGPTDYQGPRKADGIVQYALSLYKQSATAPKVKQLTSREQFDEDCNGKVVCVLAFLPHILDSQAAGRNKYLTTLKTVAEKFKDNAATLRYFWAEAFEQQALEGLVEVGGAGYPALSLLSMDKGRYVNLRGTFTDKTIGNFVKQILRGAQSTLPLNVDDVSPAIKTQVAWDGKDGVLPHEEL
jgi:protein disulfide-isomerase A6